ncbi:MULTISPECIES: response regulator [unclassified Siphonobacter]|uniref:response regulator n=1 Tax=unclassified Siphonobacter TaxID=2635712 RepID=UPI00278149D2|nr:MULTISPECIES: response regulator [unclassified Siphonobacter]MDQ1090032.1 CheY-like chemotaxis protein [Siphonobacter sp. SORGH_AS_1065]MDR6197428.1 CheY-like chemotaxis protein [Siphonobacter sp. SORGH_AS_0500]
MSLQGPIISVEDDEDDQYLIQSVIDELGITNRLLFFNNGKAALDYLLVTEEQPFFIICDVNMPIMNGLELHMHLISNEELKKKSIPFIFFTTAANAKLIDEAYQQMIQGFYRKGSSFIELKEQIQTIYNYWKSCLHPSNLPT